MTAVVKIGLLVIVSTFAVLGILIVLGVPLPNTEVLLTRVGGVLGILFVASLVVAFISRPSGESRPE